MLYRKAKIANENQDLTNTLQQKPDPKKRKGDDLSIPPWFDLPKSFYRQLAASAKEFGITRQAFLAKAVQYYSAHLRKENAPLSKALGDTELADLFAEARRKTAKEWWDKLSPEERSARAKRASDARKGGKARRDAESAQRRAAKKNRRDTKSP